MWSSVRHAPCGVIVVAEVVMRQLNGADRYQLYIESVTHHQHTLKVLRFDPADLRQPLTLERLRRWAEVTLPRCAPLRWRIASLPAGRPVWIDDPGLELRYHVNREVLPEPGGRDEFGRLLARLKETKLDRSRPLWRLWLVEGFADGGAAFVWSLHHALSDGGGTVSILEQVFDHDAYPASAGEVTAETEEAPGVAALAGMGLGGFATRTVRLPALIGRSFRAARVNRAWRRAEPIGPARPFQGPVTPFGHAITPRRTCATASVSFRDVAEVRRAFGCTVNDVFLTLASGALASYLAHRGELPERSLTAGMPVSIRTPEVGLFGNHLSTWFIRLATDEPDPVARLEAISRATRAVRQLSVERRSERLQLDWMEHTLLFKAYIAFGNLTTRRAGRPPFNVILSSVKGPVPLWFDGAPITEIQSYSQLAAGIGLNITAWTYGGKLTAGFVACPEHVSDLWDLADRMAPALTELRSAVREAVEVA